MILLNPVIVNGALRVSLSNKIVVDLRNTNIMFTLHYSLTIVLIRFGIKIYGSKFD